VPEANQDPFDEWRVADTTAHAMEQAMTRASLDALDGYGELSSDNDCHRDRGRARRLRRVANGLFRLAMVEMTARAARARR
jgi:hypothetical protein